MGTRTITVNAAWLLKPAGSDSLNKADDEMRAERAAFQERISEEHYFDLSGTQTSHGIHKPGSAVALVTAAPPAYRLDGTSRFTTTLDKGRLCIDATDGRLTYLDTANGSGTDVWKYVNPNDAPGDFDVGGSLDVGTDGHFGGDVSVDGDTTLNGTLSVTGTDGDLAVGGDAVIDGALSVGGSSCIGFKFYKHFSATDTENDVYDYFASHGVTVDDDYSLFGMMYNVGAPTSVFMEPGYIRIVYSAHGAVSSLRYDDGDATAIGHVMDIWHM